ncbi:S-layer homology domain-containing protein [Paenibacillus sp. CAA11]|uniref:S-layer homology domain-containing protein n=1 Tax=Paenibacillus sp. CAA11 TaxID=1532905 RepID=UPI001F242AE9|nr:S-layer homology domain-containing protein [Paenibacillus sp. CAA11]
MKYEHKFPEFKNLSDKTLQGMTLRDLIAQDVKGLSLKAIFNMPYDVKQIAGGSTGVTVKGKSIHLDYLKMIKSGGREWKFESLKNGGKFSFSDVKSNSWYSKAVNAVSEGGMFSGFSDGAFKPDKAMSLAELFKVIAIGSGELNSNHPVYWAAGYVAFAKANGLVLSDVEETSKYWDTPATREQAVYALAVAANNLDKKEVNDTIKSDSIKDWNSIDSRMREMIRFAYNAGIVRGNEDGTFNPKSKITRAEISQILYNINWTKPKK